MNEQNKEEIQEETPKSTEGVPAAQSFSWKRLLAKRWVFPATYVAVAAIILTLMWVYQDAETKKLSRELAELGAGLPVQDGANPSEGQDHSLAVTAPAETMRLPFDNAEPVSAELPYYDSGASAEVKQSAMIQIGNTFTPHVGIDFAREDNQSFDVVAALSGTVTTVERNPLVGYLVEIEHNDGLVTVYQSLSDVLVSKGQEVKQGDMIAKAGRNELEKETGYHLHFEVRKNGKAMNPQLYLEQN